MTAPHPFAGITQIRSWGRPSLRDLSAWLIQAPPGSIEFGAVYADKGGLSSQESRPKGVVLCFSS